MKRFCLFVIVGVGLMVLVRPASAQLSGKTKSDAKTEATRIANERRAQARSLLLSLAAVARTFRDLKLRARSLARIADVLWSVEAEQGRALFRKAWEAAETADETQGSYTLGHGPLNVRSEVLEMSAKRDRLLAEEFLQQLKSDDGDERSEEDPLTLPEVLRQRLNLAESLLRSGDTERALHFADPALRSVTTFTLTFLTHLRERNPAAADQRYAALLANTGDNMMADANTISVLSSYIFTPQAYVIFSPYGIAATSNPPAVIPPANVGPQLTLAFFRTATSVLLRPQPPPEQDRSTTGTFGNYFAVKHLMPIFDQYAPKEVAVAMHGQLEALNSLVSTAANEVQPDRTSLQKLIPDQEESLLDQVETAKTSDERDRLHFKLALLAVSKNDLRARDYVSKIDESDFRQQAQAWVDWSLAVASLKEKKTDVALELVRTGELTHIKRVWVLTQSAKLLAKTDRDKALSLLDEAASEARRIDGGDLDRPRGLLAIANALRLIEPPRAWEAIFDAVKAANSTEGFTGEDGALVVTIKSGTEIWNVRDVNPDFELAGIFGEVANTDFERTVQLARGFQDEAPRANATIAIARALLNEKTVVPTTLRSNRRAQDK